MGSLYNPFAAAARDAVATALGLPQEFPVSIPPRPELGDFAVGCFPAAKALRQSPAKIATEAAQKFVPTELLASAEATGPFVNFRANRDALFRHLFEHTGNATQLLPTGIGGGSTVCIDFSAPNISKHLAYHHIRSTVIGHALVNLYRAVGYKVVGINHLGDWGTTHGMLLAAYHRWTPQGALDVQTLNDLYVRFRAEMKNDPNLEQEGRAWFKKLEDGDEAARALWQKFKEVSWAEFESIYGVLGISFDEVKGESEYENAMQPVIDQLASKNLTEVSQGALVVNLDELKLPPLLLRKQDGATLYATRDLAAGLYRWNTYAFTRSLYVVDRGQAVHFKQVFHVLGLLGLDAERLTHVTFGLVRIGGKKTGTRSGNVVLLKEVLREAEDRSHARVQKENVDMDNSTLNETARQIGVGAVVFANLMSQREKDVDFSWEDILSTSGDSGPYVQYGHARAMSVLRKAAAKGWVPSAAPTKLSSEFEWALAKLLLDFGEATARSADANEPHTLCRYLLELTSAFNRFYTSGNQNPSLRILCDDPEVAAARLALVDSTRKVLAEGLRILGIGAPNSM